MKGTFHGTININTTIVIVWNISNGATFHISFSWTVQRRSTTTATTTTVATK